MKNLVCLLFAVLISCNPSGDKKEKSFVTEIDNLANEIGLIQFQQECIMDSIIQMAEKGYLTESEYSNVEYEISMKIIEPLEILFGETLFGIIPISQGSIGDLYTKVLDSYGYNFDDLGSYSECSTLENIPPKVKDAFKRVDEKIDSFNKVIEDFKSTWKEVSVVNLKTA